MRIDLDSLRSSASGHMGDVLSAIGSELGRWAKPDRGRARCPFGCGATGFPVSYADGRARCHYEGKSWSAIDLVAEKYGLGFREAAERLSDILGGDFAEAPRPRPEPVRKLRQAEDVSALWETLPAQDERGESYLTGRGLWHGPFPDVVRFNVPGAATDPDLARRARQGYRVAFAARRPDGKVGNISLRFVGDGPPPDEKKTVSLTGGTTKGVAIMRPEAAQLAGDFAGDALLFCEGGPDFLAWTHSLDVAALDGEEVPTWALGCIGAGIAEAVVLTFAPLVRGRWVRLALDGDKAGEEGAARAADAAWRAGASRVTRIRLDGAKDAAEVAEQEARNG
ncbi:MAG: hypothetical protein KBB14_20475 [Thermoanaerobaculia bacterium]|nr:hypothetical protein [Thermoanaerobaculia bacterium]